MPRTLAPPAARRPRAFPAAAPAASVLRLSEAAYLARERDPARAEARQSELLAGGIVREMPNVRRPHSLLVDNLTFEIGKFLDRDRFERHHGDLKFRPPECRYFYPDLLVTPSPPALLDDVGDVVLDPKFVAEVLSPSTEAIDRGEKLACYLGTPSVLEYWMVSQAVMRVERHHRDPGGEWRDEVHEDPAGAVPLPALGGAVSLAELYRRVPLAAG